MDISDRFEIAWTADFRGEDGSPRYADVGADVLDQPPRLISRIIPQFLPVLAPAQIGQSQAVIVLSPRVAADSVRQAESLLAIGRFGVGYDSVDVPACTAANVMVIIAAGAVDRSVAEAVVGWMLALSHHVRTKDALVRAGKWGQRGAWMGRELRGRTLGIVGLGGIGRALVRLLDAFGMAQPLAFDPFVTPESAAALGVRLVPLETLLETADFVSIHCPLNESTRVLIGSTELARMRPDAFLINTARGGIVDESALHDALSHRRIAGAAIDVFEVEPFSEPPRLAELENVLLAPHCIAWTDELFRDIGRTVCQSLRQVAEGSVPAGLINPEVLRSDGFREKWRRLAIGGAGIPDGA